MPQYWYYIKELKENEMTVKEFLESKEKLAIHCDSEEKANKLLKKFDELGEVLYRGQRYWKKNYWSKHKKQTCYSNGYQFSNKQDYKNLKYKIIEFDDLEDFKEIEKTDTIIIKRSGNVITAYKGENKAVARCNPEDKFNLLTSCNLALERLLGEENKPLEAYLSLHGFPIGYIGEKADFNALFGEELFVGDIVEIYNPHYKCSVGKSFVCKVPWVGYAVATIIGEHFNDGISRTGWQIRKVGSYKDLVNGQVIGNFKVVKE